jgi:hypothetical protein
MPGSGGRTAGDRLDPGEPQVAQCERLLVRAEPVVSRLDRLASVSVPATLGRRKPQARLAPPPLGTFDATPSWRPPDASRAPFPSLLTTTVFSHAALGGPRAAAATRRADQACIFLFGLYIAHACLGNPPVCLWPVHRGAGQAHGVKTQRPAGAARRPLPGRRRESPAPGEAPPVRRAAGYGLMLWPQRGGQPNAATHTTGVPR